MTTLPVRHARTGTIHHRGPWQIPYKATDVLCSDGVYRTARTAMEADTYFSLPASVKVKGKTVSGYLYTSSWGPNAGQLIFVAYTHRKNGQLLPEWPPIV